MQINNSDIKTIIRELLNDGHTYKLYENVGVEVLRESIVILAKIVRDAKPIIQNDADMMSSISRFAPLPEEAQAAHDRKIYPSEMWIDQFNKLCGE